MTVGEVLIEQPEDEAKPLGIPRSQMAEEGWVDQYWMVEEDKSALLIGPVKQPEF